MDQPHGNARRVAFFGGSFDPPHQGHLAVARAAQAALRLDSVLFAPVGTQPLKPQGSAASFEDRLAMTELAIAGEPAFRISLADAPNRDGAPNYTLETLLALRTGLPPGGALFCLMGADSFFGLQRWHRAAEIPFVAPLIVASRPDQQPHSLVAELKAALPEGLTMESAPVPVETGSEVELRSCYLLNRAGDRTPFYLLPGLNVEISASQIRERTREQISASEGSLARRDALPEAVAAYIQSHNLYR